MKWMKINPGEFLHEPKKRGIQKQSEKDLQHHTKQKLQHV